MGRLSKQMNFLLTFSAALGIAQASLALRSLA